MKKRLIILKYLAFVLSSALAQDPPRWIVDENREEIFPQKDYFNGFVAFHFNKTQNLSDFQDKLEASTRIALVESIYNSIKNDSPDRKSESLDLTKAGKFNKNTITKFELEQIGLSTKTYLDKENRIGYGLAHVEKKKLISHYFMKLKREAESLQELIMEEDSSYQMLMQGLVKVERLMEYQKILRRMNVNNKLVLMEDHIRKLKLELEEKLKIIKDSKEISLKEASEYLIDHILTEAGIEIKSLLIQPLIYKNTSIITEFSTHFDELLKQTLLRTPNQILIEETLPENHSGLELIGSYWPKEEKIQLVIGINEVINGEVIRWLAGSSLEISYEEIKQLGISYHLVNEFYEYTKEKNLTPIQGKGGLVAELSTEKNRKSVVYKEGEIMQLFTMVSQPAYIRIINIWSDDQMFLLVDNHFVTPENAGVRLKLNISWETSCPCGKEYLFLVASDKPLPPLRTENHNGFQKVKMSIQEIVEDNRAFIKIDGIYYAESSVTITTIPRSLP